MAKLKPYERFAKLIERHWDGIAAFSKPENKISLGFVEGLNNKIRVIQRRAYGLRDEEYLSLENTYLHVAGHLTHKNDRFFYPLDREKSPKRQSPVGASGYSIQRILQSDIREVP